MSAPALVVGDRVRVMGGPGYGPNMKRQTHGVIESLETVHGFKVAYVRVDSGGLWGFQVEHLAKVAK